ncbi:MAG: thioredoxin family protein [Paenisporosarcina sp.]
MKEWSRAEWETISRNAEIAAYYLYTPMCGTCQVASKMLAVVEELTTDTPMGKANLNFENGLAHDYQIESVPCLLISVQGEIREKIYAFHSVTYLYEKLRNYN